MADIIEERIIEAISEAGAEIQAIYITDIDIKDFFDEKERIIKEVIEKKFSLKNGLVFESLKERIWTGTSICPD